MAYSELIKNFSRIREYMRQFYIYGFKTRDEYDAKSARSYDNERRRIESWLGEYMSFRQDASGKAAFISVDSSDIKHNPLYNAFKAKSFTSNDITLHFYILDILEEHEACTVAEISEIISDEYSCDFPNAKVLDESTIRNKLKEYESLGLLVSEKAGRKVVYRKASQNVDLDKWKEAVAFFSELDPLGVVGSFVLDKIDEAPEFFNYKHHYILHTLESEIMCKLLDCISKDYTAIIKVFSKRKNKQMEYEILPFKVFIGTQSGRSYVFGMNLKDNLFNMYRLDNIETVEYGSYYKNKNALAVNGEAFLENIWYTSSNNGKNVYHLEMVLNIENWAEHILKRLEREGKQGKIEHLSGNLYKYSIDVFDPGEMQPWIRTFIGRIVSLTCDHKETEERFYRDLEAMYEMYGGDGNDI